MKLEALFSMLANKIFGVLELLIICGIITCILKGRFSVTKKCEATLIDKRRYDERALSKSRPQYTKQTYILIFLCGDKKMFFKASALLYSECQINQTGTLKYKGSRLIDFS